LIQGEQTQGDAQARGGGLSRQAENKNKGNREEGEDGGLPSERKRQGVGGWVAWTGKKALKMNVGMKNIQSVRRKPKLKNKKANVRDVRKWNRTWETETYSRVQGGGRVKVHRDGCGAGGWGGGGIT